MEESTNSTGNPAVPVSGGSQELQKKSLVSKLKGIPLIPAIVLIILIVVLLVVGFILTRKEDDQSPPVLEKATSLAEDVVLATVYGENILVSDVNLHAYNSLGARALDQQTLKEILNILIERKILDHEVEIRGISIEPNVVKNEEFYSSIREKVIVGEVSAVTAIQIGWWIPPPSEYEQLPIHALQREEAEQASVEIEKGLREDTDVFELLDAIGQKYANLKPILSLNGTIYSPEKKSEITSVQREFKFDSELDQFPKYKVMKGMTEGEVKRSIFDDESGGVVTKIVSVTEGEKIGYREWLNAKIAENVSYNLDQVEKL